MALSIKYCKLCGKPFNYKVTLYCSACMIDIDDAFDKCRNYLDKNDFVTIKELSEKTEISEKIILMLLKEDRLSFEGINGLACEGCGEPIRNGRYCGKCTTKKQSEFNEVKMVIKKDITPKKVQSYSGKEKMHIAPSNNTEKRR